MEYRIGHLRLQPGRQLFDGNDPLPIGRKALDILSVLAAADGRLVTKDELLNAVWPGVIVEENAIQVHVSTARRALGREACRLATVWGRGYRLEAAPLDPAGTVAEPALPATQIDPEAIRMVAQARALAGRITPDALLRAIDLQERAITLDPGYAAAWTGLAGTLTVATMTGALPPERRGSARAMAEQAIRVDSGSGAPYAIRAVLDAGECRWLDAEASLRAAVARSPDDPQVRHEMHMLWASIGHIDRAKELAEAAARSAPASPNIVLSHAHIAMLVGDMATMAAQLDTAALLGLAEDRITMRILQAERAVSTGNVDAATTNLAALLGSLPTRPATTDAAAAEIATALTCRDDPAAASASIMRLVAAGATEGALGRAQMLLGVLVNWQVRLGALDAAFVLAGQLLEKREQSGYVTVRAIQQWWRTDMAPFRADSRFSALALALALPTAWRQLGWPDSLRPGEAP